VLNERFVAVSTVAIKTNVVIKKSSKQDPQTKKKRWLRIW